MAIANWAGLADSELEALERELSPLHLLEDVVGWAFSREPPASIAEVVVQDEFAHDVVLPISASRVLVFGTT